MPTLPLTKRLPPNSKSHTHNTHWQEQVNTCYTVTNLQALVSIAQGKTHCRTSSRKRGLTWAMLSGQPKGGWLARIASRPAQIAAKHVDAFQPQAIVQLSRSSLSMPTLHLSKRLPPNSKSHTHTQHALARAGRHMLHRYESASTGLYRARKDPLPHIKS